MIIQKTNRFDDYATALVTAGVASASVTFTDQASIQARAVSLYNSGSVTVYVAKGTTTATAAVPTGTPAVNATPVPAGTTVLLFKAPGQNVIAFITPSSTAVLLITCGA